MKELLQCIATRATITTTFIRMISLLRLKEIKEHQDICLEDVSPFAFLLEILSTEVQTKYGS